MLTGDNETKERWRGYFNQWVYSNHQENFTDSNTSLCD